MTLALVIDDVEEMALNVSRMLNVLGVETRKAHSVREGMLHLMEGIPDIVFLDIKMPGFDGFEVLTYLRREPRLADVPVCIISTEDQEETIAKARRLGVVGYLIKPISVEDLEAVLKRNSLLPAQQEG